MSGHAQLKFVMTECLKTQIRLTGIVYLNTKKNPTKVTFYFAFFFIEFRNSDFKHFFYLKYFRLYFTFSQAADLKTITKVVQINQVIIQCAF